MTTNIVNKQDGTAEDCSDALNDFSEQHQLVVEYDWPEGSHAQLQPA